TDSLVRVGSGIDKVYKHNSDLQPRVGIIWNPTGDGRLAVRGAYALMINQGNTGGVTGTTAKPPLAPPLNVTGNVPLDSARSTAPLSHKTAPTSPAAKGCRILTCGIASASTAPTSCRSTATG